MRVHKFLFLLPLLLILVNCDRDPKKARQKYLDNGNKYYDRGKYKEASIMYRRSLQKDLRFGEAWYRLGLANLKLAQFGEARRDFSRASELDPNNTDAFVKLGDLDLAAAMLDPKNSQVALNELKDIISAISKKDANSYDALRLSGYMDLTQKNYAGAIGKFEKANTAKPDQPELMLSLVQTLFIANRSDEAERYAKIALQKNKTYGPLYDILFQYYFHEKKLDLAEQILKQKVANNPTQGAYLVELAVLYYSTGRKQEMLAEINKLTSDTKTFPNGHLLAGDFYFQIRDFQSAYDQYQEGQKQDSKERSTYTKRMIEVLSMQNKNKEAQKMADDLLKQDPKDPETIAMHAALLLQNGNKQQAKEVISELQPLVAKTPNSPILHFNLGRAYMAQGDPQSMEQARLQFEETMKLRSTYVPAKMALAQLALNRRDYAKATALSDEVLATDPNYIGAMLIRAVSLIGTNELGKAREQLESILKAYPRSNDARYQLAVLNVAEKRFKEANDGFEELKKSGDPRGTIGLVEVEVAQNKFDEALQTVRAQLQQTPDRGDFQLAEANVLYRAGHYQEAAAAFQKIADSHPKDADIFVRLGETRSRVGDTTAAIAAFKKAHELAPSEISPLLQMAILYDNSARNDEARRAYEEVLKLQPDNAAALNNLAYLKADDNVDLDQALTYAQRAQQEHPENLDIRDTVSFIYIRKNLTDDGIRVLRDLIKQNPQRATFHLHLALAYFQRGDKNDAKRELDAASHNNPSEKEQVRIKELMAKIG